MGWFFVRLCRRLTAGHGLCMGLLAGDMSTLAAPTLPLKSPSRP